MGTAVDKFLGNVEPGIARQKVISHPEAVRRVIPAWIPTERGRHSAGIRGCQIAERKAVASIVAMASRYSGHQRMHETVADTATIAAIVDRVLAEGFRHQVARCRRGNVDSVVAAETLEVSFGTPAPFRRSARPCAVDLIARSLVDAGRGGASENCIGAERIEYVTLKLRTVRRFLIRLTRLGVARS